jgi:hypothetical protein
MKTLSKPETRGFRFTCFKAHIFTLQDFQSRSSNLSRQPAKPLADRFKLARNAYAGRTARRNLRHPMADVCAGKLISLSPFQPFSAASKGGQFEPTTAFTTRL